MKPKPKERDIQRAVLDYLKARNILAFRMNTGATQASYNGKHRFFRYGVKGMADLVAFPNWTAAPHWIEVKGPKGRTTPEQDSFAELVRSHGHVYAVIRSIEDLEELL